jgi:hypothetical protein
MTIFHLLFVSFLLIHLLAKTEFETELKMTQESKWRLNGYCELVNPRILRSTSSLSTPRLSFAMAHHLTSDSVPLPRWLGRSSAEYIRALQGSDVRTIADSLIRPHTQWVESFLYVNGRMSIVPTPYYSLPA